MKVQYEAFCMFAYKKALRTSNQFILCGLYLPCLPWRLGVCDEIVAPLPKSMFDSDCFRLRSLRQKSFLPVVADVFFHFLSIFLCVL